MKVEYLFFNIIILVTSTFGPFILKKKSWPGQFASLIAISVTSILFIIWDQLVTGWWWTFNEEFILGYKIGKLPLEEILFFIVVPWSCLVIWENLKLRIKGEFELNYSWKIVGLFVFGAIFCAFYQKYYFMSVLMAIVLLLVCYKHTNLPVFKRKVTFMFFLIVMLLTGVFNSYLTYRPVVEYNPKVLVNLRIGTIPIEDFGYGFLLIGMTVIIYEKYLEYTNRRFSN